MGSPPFQPTHAVRFEVGRGLVAMGGDARVLVPPDALVSLCRAAGAEGARDFGHQIGTEVGRRVASRWGDAPTVPAVVEHLGGEWALLGLGSLGVEVWGRALVVRVEGSPFGRDGDELLAAVLEAVLRRALSRDATVVPMERDDARVRLLVVGPRAAERVRGWLESGVAWGDALARLQAGAP